MVGREIQIWWRFRREQCGQDKCSVVCLRFSNQPDTESARHPWESLALVACVWWECERHCVCRITARALEDGGYVLHQQTNIVVLHKRPFVYCEGRISWLSAQFRIRRMASNATSFQSRLQKISLFRCRIPVPLPYVAPPTPPVRLASHFAVSNISGHLAWDTQLRLCRHLRLLRRTHLGWLPDS